MKKITVLYSGGIDSLGIMILAGEVYSYGDKPVFRYIFFDIGQPYLEKELVALPPEVEIRKIDWLRNESAKGKNSPSGDIYIPGRNLVFVALAAAITCPDEIWLGALAGETHDKAHDKNWKFRSKANDCLGYVFQDFCFNGINVRFPLAELGWNKLHVVKYMMDHGVSKERIIATSSCLSGDDGKCGECVVCLRRWGVFTQLGFSESYNVNPLSSLANRKILVEMLREDSYYNDSRKDEVIPALKMADTKLYDELCREAR